MQSTTSVNKFNSRVSLKSRIMQNLKVSDGMVTPVHDARIRDGALELFENIFGDQIVDDKKYSKEELLDLAQIEISDDENQDREPLIFELLDTIFENIDEMNKSEILKAIIEVIKDDQFFNSAFSEQIQETQVDPIEETKSFEAKEAQIQNEESEFQIMAEKASQPASRKKTGSIYSTGKHIELLNLNKKRFLVSMDG